VNRNYTARLRHALLNATGPAVCMRNVSCSLFVQTFSRFCPQHALYCVEKKHMFQMKPTRCTLLLSIFISTSVHVSDNYVSIIRRTYCIYATLCRGCCLVCRPALEGASGQQQAPAATYPREKPGTQFQEAVWAPGSVWTGGTSRPHRGSIPDRPVRSSVAILTELPGPYIYIYIYIYILEHKRKMV